MKRVGKDHQNVVILHDYFETAHNLYLCFNLCTGGELFDRICAKGNYYEADACALIRTIFKAIKHMHDSGIVHRNLKPEHLLFRTQAEDADIMITNFSFCRIMDENKDTQQTDSYDTPTYMAPEILQKIGHGKPVDVWAMGVISYFMLGGYTPFDRDTRQAEMEAIVRGDYSFTPPEYWVSVLDVAKDFVRNCLSVDQHKRPTAAEALEHQWLKMNDDYFVRVNAK
ncbi:hypothetical protein D9619_009670 [Psilocybe cf. subviscida]|uniref:Protein kinase domain-containing protein n=1 Tax=Psilocybe cf. subviscida TaxID=2480587 RepID=A0A8H5BNJ3_9AGAR|nr:hypothetical protein D9619_009670 [Psilocybe cf. subviscida]